MDYHQRENLTEALRELERIHAQEGGVSSVFYGLVSKASLAGDDASTEALTRIAARRANDQGEIGFMIDDMREKLQEAELEAQQEQQLEQSTGIVQWKVYFDVHGYVVGASTVSDTHEDFYEGEYASCEWLEAPEDFVMLGKTREQIQEAVRYRRGY